MYISIDTYDCGKNSQIQRLNKMWLTYSCYIELISMKQLSGGYDVHLIQI